MAINATAPISVKMAKSIVNGVSLVQFQIKTDLSVLWDSKVLAMNGNFRRVKRKSLRSTVRIGLVEQRVLCLAVVLPLHHCEIQQA